MTSAASTSSGATPCPMRGCGQSDVMLLARCRRMSSSLPSVSAWEPIMRIKPCPVVLVGVPFL
eukprot:1690769-Heterocapsa_arctica.AAC.1